MQDPTNPTNPAMFDNKAFFDYLRDVVCDQVSIIDATVDYAEKYGIEIEVLASVIKQSPTMKALMEVAAEDLNFIEKTARLPGA